MRSLTQRTGFGFRDSGFEQLSGFGLRDPNSRRDSGFELRTPSESQIPNPSIGKQTGLGIWDSLGFVRRDSLRTQRDSAIRESRIPNPQSQYWKADGTQDLGFVGIRAPGFVAHAA